MEPMQRRIQEFLRGERIALVGATNRREKWGYRIFRALRGLGYKVYPIHPSLREIEGEPVYRSLRELPEKPDGVSVVVPPGETEEVLRLCSELGIERVWLQPGAESEEGIEFCERSGLTCIHNKCILFETGKVS